MANQFKKSMVTAVGTTPVVAYSTNSSTRATVIGINVANVTAGNILVSIIFEDENLVQGYIVKDVAVGKNTALAAMGGDQKLVLEPNNSILVVTNANNGADVIVSSLEIIS